MDHNNLDVIGDFIAPLSEFLENFSIVTNNADLKLVKCPKSPKRKEMLEVTGAKENIKS